MPNPLLVADEISVSFGRKTVLTGLSMSAGAGAVTALLGPNGAGKTTFVRCCTGLVEPTAGRLEVLGGPPGNPRAQAGVGLMPQSAGAWSAINGRDLVTYLASLYANPLPVADLLDELGATKFATTPYRRLSGGQKQLINLAGALVGRPALVFLDEPTAGLDPHARRRTWDVVRGLRADGLGIVLTTHAMDEAAALADYVWLLDRGRIVQHGTVPELTKDASLEDVFLAATHDEEELA